MSLEYIVRPYQTPNGQGAIVIPSARQGLPQRASLTWGAQGTMPPAQVSSINVVCCNEDHNELSREGETVRINGNDGESYVDVFRANKLKFQKQEPAGGSKCKNAFSTVAYSDTVSGGVTTDAGTDTCSINMTLKNNTAAA